MSHKTLYIDVDEEITSIIDRIRKSAASEVIIVAPKQALLLQSLVNLKLLKKETTRRKKKIMIVTQDKLGKKLIEKAGILVQGKMHDLDEDPIEIEAVQEREINSPIGQNILSEEVEQELEVGSDKYFDEPLEKAAVGEENIGQVTFQDKNEPRGKKMPSDEKKKKASLDVERKKSNVFDQRVQMSDIVAGPKPKSARSKRLPAKKKEETPKVLPQASGYYKKALPHREISDKTNEFFGQLPVTPQGKSRRKEKIMKTGRVHGKPVRYFVIFFLLLIVLSVLSGVYFFLPKATILLYLQNEEKNLSLPLEANAATSEAQSDKGIIPANPENLAIEKSKEFSASGSKNGGGTANGRVTIYNEYSADDQPLVATTRLETTDGKIFRITKNIIVPGVSKVGAETQPGAVEVTVVADKPGEDYNIEPTTFKITGFKGGPKFDKFYAKSTNAMTGGAVGETLVVTAQDIADGKKELIAEMENEAAAKLRGSLPEGRIIFDEAVTEDIADFSSSAPAGTQADKFTLTAKINAKTLSFSEEDVKKVLASQLNQEGSAMDQSNFKSPINYILSEASKDNTSLKFEAKADAESLSGFDIDNFKRGALGKNSAELEALVKNYPFVLKAEVNFWPFFVNRVPMNEKRVSVERK